MKEDQRSSIESIYKKLGSSKTRYLIKKISESDKKDISSMNIQEWTGIGPQYSRQVIDLLDSFECPESFCVAMEMQDERDSEKLGELGNTRLIMTGPISESNVGYTLGNFRKLIETAKNEIILVGYVFNNIEGQMDPVIESLMSATSRGVGVKIFFEKGASAKSLINIWKKSKSYQTPELYYYKKKTQHSVLHAKALIRDDDTIFVTSANLTGSAMEKNIELGILHHGKLASEAKKILQYLIVHGYMVPEK